MFIPLAIFDTTVKHQSIKGNIKNVVLLLYNKLSVLHVDESFISFRFYPATDDWESISMPLQLEDVPLLIIYLYILTKLENESK